MNAIPTVALMTAEEYALLPDNGRPTELVRGRVVPMNIPVPRHGQICSKVDRIVGTFADEHRVGHVVCNDSGVVTERDPDTIRGADIAFYSYARVPPGPFPAGYLAVVPELIFEVRSPSDRWPRIHVKVGEYLDAGVTAVVVLDDQTRMAHVYYADQGPRSLSADEELTLPGILEGFRVAVSRFFE